MKCAVIDIGSNSMRLSVYEVEHSQFRTLFKEKIMAGLAGYVTGQKLSEEGIRRACEGMQQFGGILNALQIDRVSVFATASLRNISNTEEAVDAIEQQTGFSVEVISGYDETLFGFSGAMCDISLNSGIFLDIGGASTEVAFFKDRTIQTAKSFPIGSLKLYTECVKKILPGKSSREVIAERIQEEIGETLPLPYPRHSQIACVGGTARAVLKFARSVFGLPKECRTVTDKQVNTLCKILCKRDEKAVDLILKIEPERIHTIIPGILILNRLIELFEAESIIVSNYGVREGFLCQRMQNNL